jgi:hypothetical protein
MKQIEEEQGFLSNKFEDWSGEPIPNGWNEIEKKLGHPKKRRPFLWWLFPAALIVGFATYQLLPSNQELNNDEAISLNQNLGSEEKPGDRIAGNPESQQGKTATTISTTPEKTKGLGTREGNQKSISEAGPDNGNVTSANSPEAVSNSERKNSGYSKGLSPVAPGSNNGRVQQPRNSGSGKSRNSNPSNPGASGSGILPAQAIASEGLETRQKRNPERTSSTRSFGTGSVASTEESAAPPFSQAPNSVENQNETSPPDLSVVPPSSSHKAGLDDAREIHNTDGLKTRAGVIEISNPGQGIPELVRIEDVPAPFLENRISPKWVPSVSFSGGIGQNEIQLRQAESFHKVSIANSNSIQSWFLQVSGRMNYRVAPWLQAFAGLQVGVFFQELKFLNTMKNPDGFAMTMHDSLNYSLQPQWKTVAEVRSQKLIFANTEIGIKPLISRAHQSGPFAAVLFWTRISEWHTSNSAEGSPFNSKTSSTSWGYRFGYQHRIKNRVQAELYLSSFPGKILSGTKGVSVSPRLIGLGLNFDL